MPLEFNTPEERARYEALEAECVACRRRDPSRYRTLINERMRLLAAQPRDVAANADNVRALQSLLYELSAAQKRRGALMGRVVGGRR